MYKHSSAIAMAAAAVVFILMFALLPSAGPLLRLAGPTVLALLAAAGIKLALWRSSAQITDDAYEEDALERKQECLALVGRIQRAAGGVASAPMREQVARVGEVVPELLERVQRTAPTSLYSSASQLRGHLTSLEGVVTTFADIEQHPAFYHQPAEQLAAGEQAVRRFVDFTLDNIRLVNQGDVAQYKANLTTVAPPEIPSLDASAPTSMPDQTSREMP